MGRVAYLFPGQGSQEVGMGLGFADASPAAGDVFRRADDALGFELSSLIRNGPADRLGLTENTQPAVLVASIAALEAGRAAGLPPPDFVAGHSLGEYAALVAAGVISLESAAKAVRSRGRFMQDAVPVGTGAMAAVMALDIATVEGVCREVEALRPGECVVCANRNSANQTVIAGHKAAVELATTLLLKLGARKVIPLDVSAPFHSPLMAPVQPQLAQVLEMTAFLDARTPVVTNVDAVPESSGGALRNLLVAQVTAPVRWTEIVARLAADGCDTFLEFGPGSVLTGLVKRQVEFSRCFAISTPEKLAAAKQAIG